MTAILRLQLDDKDPVRVNSAINQLAEFVDRGGGGAGARTILTANTTYYVATTGSDSNSGTSVGSPFLTIQHVYDVIIHTLDTAGFTTTIQCASGTYTIGLSISIPWTGGGLVVLDLGGGTISSSGNCVAVLCLLPNTFQIRNGTLTSSGSSCIAHLGTGTVLVGAGMTFGPASVHLQSQGVASLIQAFSPYTISGGASWHYLAVKTGNSIQAGTAVTISGTVTIGGQFALATRLGELEMPGMTFSGSTPTGQRYQADTNGVIFTAGGGANYFPGTVAGTTTTGGQYA